MPAVATCENMNDDVEFVQQISVTSKRAHDKPMARRYEALSVLRVEKVSDKAILPTRATAQSAGLDLYSVEDLEIKAGERALVETGLKIAIPEGCYGRVAPRSGLAVKHGINVGAGVVDADYRGPLKVVMFNLSKELFRISAGDRIAQLICEKIEMPETMDCTAHSLDSTERGEAGFGSTGGFGNDGPSKI